MSQIHHSRLVSLAATWKSLRGHLSTHKMRIGIYPILGTFTYSIIIHMPAWERTEALESYAHFWEFICWAFLNLRHPSTFEWNSAAALFHICATPRLFATTATVTLSTETLSRIDNIIKSWLYPSIVTILLKSGASSINNAVIIYYSTDSSTVVFSLPVLSSFLCVLFCPY